MEFMIQGSEPLPVDAQTAGEELERIRLEHNHLSPAVVVDESRPEDAPLHPVFEWRDPVAAEQWREHQAATLIKRVRIIPAPPEPAPVAQRVTPAPAAAAPAAAASYRPDPLAHQMAEAVGLLVESARMLEELHAVACRRMDGKRRIALSVALAEVREAHEVLVSSGAKTASEQLAKAIAQR